MKYWKEKENNSVESMQFWQGTTITKLEENEIFIMGTNPSGIHGSGAAKAGLKFGAKMLVGRGLMGSTYGLITKNLKGKAGFVEKATGLVYDKEGYCSVSPEQISANIDEMYDLAKQPEHQNKKFLVTYQYETWPNGSPKKSLNGYTSQEILEMFVKDKDVPPNIVFHESYKPHLEKLFNDQKNMYHTYNPDDYLFFFYLTSPYSNFTPSLVKYKEYSFVSNEQFMMFGKAMLFDKEVAQRIINIENEYVSGGRIINQLNYDLIVNFKNGTITRDDIVNDKVNAQAWNSIMMKIKQLGRSVKNYDDEVWSKKRANIVLFGARLKFTQNENLKSELLSNDKKMVEASPRDKLWGIGLSEYDARKTAPENWPGGNLLGKILDHLKVELRNELKIDVVNFYHIGKKIPDDAVYIGRENKALNLTGSKFANPFAMKESTNEERDRVVDKYKVWLWKAIESEEITRDDLLALKGKKLVCYCSPKKCHGDVLKEVVQLLVDNENEFNNVAKKYKDKRVLKP